MCYHVLEVVLFHVTGDLGFVLAWLFSSVQEAIL